MPVNNPGGSGGGSGQQQAGGGGQPAGRTTFRPPWVKQGPQPIPMPAAPWTPNRRPSNTAPEAAAGVKAPEPAPVRKQSKITIIPSHPTNQAPPPLPAPAPAAPRENGQSVTAEELGAFARLAALVRKVEDMERRHDEEVLRRPSLANLTWEDDEDPPGDDRLREHLAGEEPDWWRDMQDSARGRLAREGEEDATAATPPGPGPAGDDDDGEDEDGEHEDWPGHGETVLVSVTERWVVEEEEKEVVEWEEVDDGDGAEEYACDEEEEDGSAEPFGPRRQMARTDTVERRGQPPAPAPAPAPAPVPDNNSRAAEEPRKRPVLTHQKSSTAPRPQEAAPAPAPSPAPQKAPAPPQAPAPPPPPPAPPAPPMAPPPPPLLKDKKPMTAAQQEKLAQLRHRPRKRPDYSCLMKEIESGKRLKRVVCNDRSQPLLPSTKAKGQFLYESEKSNVHNQLLKQIETGVKLKKVKTNDRSRPLLDGLRKFRRQMTIEEQLQKTASVANMVGLAPEEIDDEPDELDDIDRVRDDLQSTKQMLALELRNKEALERENKRLLARLQNLEAELEAERNRPSGGGGAAPGPAPDADRLVAKLKEENETQQKVAKEMESRYHKAAEELDATKAQLQEALFQKKQAEKQLKEIEDGLVEGGRALQKQLSKKLISSKSGDIRKQMSQARLNDMRKQSIPVPEDQEDSESEYTDETVTDSELEEEEDLSNDPEAQEKRVQRELKLLATKLKAFKDKEASARRERVALREQLKLQQKALREERAKYKSLQKEVDKMAKLMKEDDDEDGEEEEEEEEEEDEEESEESESEESEADEGSGDELPADAPVDDKRNNLNARTKRHEGILGALKKGNYLLKANIDRIKDDLSKHREMSLMLQEDLNSVLAELG
ncbi:Dynein heavy chain-like protein [Frankliniella fusca]|uniref:Dynein heavy chain-like protein n=1 Tax=Frankliniella fusca TaxID=407009 RepID=A0AAE1HCR9_9NEOP|nr:Dynein heavy chain-like protein [Frankliniella fusca]